MSDLISRADVIEAVCGACCEDGKKYEKCTIYRRGLCADLEALEALPSADAEETVLNKMLEEEMIVLPQDYVKVVRCKDCKWAEKAILDEYCVECTMYHTSCMKHGYCHHGERREP